MKHNYDTTSMSNPDCYWIKEDGSGEKLKGKTSVVLDKYFPADIIDEWFDCKIGGYEVEFEKDGIPYKLAIVEGLRGFNIPGVIVFTNQGSAYVFY